MAAMDKSLEQMRSPLVGKATNEACGPTRPMHSFDQMKPRTVYEKAVRDFAETAQQLARLDQHFRQASFAEFETLMAFDDEALKRYGLPSPWSSERSSKCIKPSCSVGITLDGGAAAPWASKAGASFHRPMLQRQCELVHTSVAQLRVTLKVGNELNSTGNEMKALMAALALLCVSSTVLAHDIYSNLRDAAGRLCCNGQDCKPVEATVLPNGTYYLPATD